MQPNTTKNYLTMTTRHGLIMRMLATATLALSMSASATAQMSRMYTTQNGLPTSDIYDIYVDSKGWAWVSGIMSLSMFDGTGFYSLINPETDTDMPPFNTVRGVREGDDGTYWVYSSNGLFIYDYSTNHFTHIFLRPDEDPVKGVSIQMFIDYPKDGYKLISTDENGIVIFDCNTMQVDTELTDKLSAIIDDNMCTEAIIDSDHYLWAVGRQLKRVNLNTMKLEQPTITDEASRIIRDHRVYNMVQVHKSGNILLATGGGLLIYDHKAGTLRTLKGGHNDMPISVVHETRNGRLLVGSDSYGIWQLTPDETLRPLNIYDPNMNLTFAKVKAIEEDDEGNLLFGLLQKGVMVISGSHDNFSYHAISPTENRTNAVAVTGLTYDPAIGYVISTDGCGVFHSTSDNLSRSRQMSAGLHSPLALTTLIDNDGTVWVGSYGGGVQCAHISMANTNTQNREQNAGKPVISEFTTPAWLQPISNDFIMTLEYDKRHNILYAGSNGRGVYVIDLNSHTVKSLRDRHDFNGWVSELFCDTDGTLWIGTSEGIYLYNRNRDSMTEVKFKDSNLLTTQCIGRLDKKTIIIATSKGLVLYDTKDKTSNVLLPDEFIKSFEITGKDIWAATQKQIVCIETDSGKIRRYSSFGGYFIGEFHGNSHTQTPNGEIFFGGDNGIISFNAKQMKQPKTLKNELVFTRLLVNGRERTYQTTDKNNVMDCNLQCATRIDLPSRENSLRLSYSVPDFASPNRINYTYCLEGYDKVWKTPAARAEVYYPNLPPGSYTLRVRAYYENNESDYKERTIQIVISQPWYNTVWAWIVYLAILSFVGYQIYKVQRERSRQRNLLTRARHNEQLKEAKLRMFTSIAHELRSPLTMILSPLKQLQSSTDDEQLLGIYDVMQRNCDRILAVVKQITDIRKIDNGQFHLHFSEVNFADYAEYICSSFTAYASAKQITFTIEHLNQNVTIWLDTIHFEKILTNILSNAFKFTPEGGRIILRTKCILKDTKDWFEIRIYNSGSQIDAKDIPHIFERFYQATTPSANAGSGIGLNLVNELVNLHHGTIEAHNIDPDGVEFVMQFPLGNAHLSEEELLPREVIADNDREQDDDLFTDIEPLVTDDSEEEPAKNKRTIIMVDDEQELCMYVKEQLQDSYNVVTANSGNSAWQEILRIRPDIVVTDIRMPDGNGIELCKRIKGNPETDNIPIIMLTSENSDRAQINSLNLQVDHFLSKPFNLLMLKGAIAHSIRLREQMKSRIRRTEVGFDYSQSTIDSVDDQLFAKVNAILKKNLDDSTFGVSELAEQVGISRVHLNRKMKERYGMSPVNFIRSYRLKQAAYFLVNNNVNISEVAYRVGFSSHSHFSNSFREFFGMTPKEFITYYSENEDDETLQKLLE